MGKDRKLFLIDDEPNVTKTLAVILRKSGYDVSAFYDAESALAHCATVSPEIVVSDVVMPGMSGIELAILLRQRFPECKIILLSGNSVTGGLIELAVKSGYNFEILAKPIHPSELLKRIAIAE